MFPVQSPIPSSFDSPPLEVKRIKTEISEKLKNALNSTSSENQGAKEKGEEEVPLKSRSATFIKKEAFYEIATNLIKRINRLIPRQVIPVHNTFGIINDGIKIFKTYWEPRTADLSSVSKAIIQRAIEEGDEGKLLQVLKGVDKELVNQALLNQELPLHYAIRCDQPHLVQLLLLHGANPFIRDYQSQSAIDHAVLLKNQKIFTLIEEFCLNYLAKQIAMQKWRESGKPFPSLIELQEKMRREIRSFIQDSALTDPLALSYEEIAIFSTIIIIHALNLVGWSINDSKLAFAMLLTGRLFEMRHIFQDSGGLVFPLMLMSNFSEFIPWIHSIYSFIKLSLIGFTFFDTLKSCKRNFKFRKLKVGLKLTVSTINTLASLRGFFDQMRQIPLTSSQCHPLTPEQVEKYRGKSLLEISQDKDLNPSCPAHAIQIFKFEEVRKLLNDTNEVFNHLPKSLKTQHRNLSASHHPDKNLGEKQLYDEASKFLNEAYTTLKNFFN